MVVTAPNAEVVPRTAASVLGAVADWSADLTPKQIDATITDAVNAGITANQIIEILTGAAAAGKFDKQDLHGWAMHMCRKLAVTDDNLDALLDATALRLHLTLAEGEAALGKVFGILKITDAEVAQTKKDCFRVAKKHMCRAK